MTRRQSDPPRSALARIVTRPEQAEALVAAGLGSVFAIARCGVQQLMQRMPRLDRQQALNIHQRACAAAVIAAREYREQRLTATTPGEQPWRTGIRALVDGPTFDSQFNPSWSDNCPPGAIEATTSPAAYLTALYQWATQVIEPQAIADDNPIPLAERRPDLAALRLDNASLERVEPTVGIVNEILESAARKHLDDHNEKQRSVDDALLGARYPFGLPFERYMSQINAVLQRKGYGLGDLIRELDPDFPYFCRGGLHSLRSDDALQMDIAIGPEQRALLLEAAYFPRGARRTSARSIQTRTQPRTGLRASLHTLQSGFYRRHYGVDSADDLLPLSAFCLRTGLDQDGLESLFSIERQAPAASPSVPGLAAPTPGDFGSVYINAGVTPVIGISSVDGEHALSNATDDHFDRIQRMVRLARWLDLPFGDADLLLDAALIAEHGEAGRGQAISENTLRALGLFRRLRRDFKVTAEDFAVLLNGVAVYARGSAKTQFDRVFNDPALFSEPLLLDDSPFNIAPASDAEYRKVHHLCSALGISHETYLYLARYIVQVLSQPPLSSEPPVATLRWSRAVVSAFYRLTRLPAWLGLSSVEAVALLQLMGDRGHQYVSRLVTPTLAVHQHSDLSDTLSVVQALADTVHWCRANDLTVSWLYQHLMPLAPVAVASDRELDLLRQINGRMRPVILSEATFIDAGVPLWSGVDLPQPIDWLKQLQTFVSAQGLIHDLPEYASTEAYEAALRQRLDEVIDNLELPHGPDVLVRVFALVMDARAAQQSLVWESLASMLAGSAEMSRELLAWTGGGAFPLLEEVMRLFDAVDSEPLPVPVGDDVLALLSRLTHRMSLIEQLSLSPLALRTYLQHPDWFEGDAPRAPVTADPGFARLHVLTQYRRLLEHAGSGEQAMLDYFRLVHELPPDLSEPDLQLIREDAAGKIAAFTGFSLRDILETMAEITEEGFVTTVRQLDHLVRIRGLCRALQLGSSAAITLGRLRSNSALADYRHAAEGALNSLTGQLQTSVGLDQGELGQSETSWIVVDNPRLVARSGEKALCLLTVKKFLGQPVAGITVTWDTSHAQLGAPSSTSTDENGQVSVELLAGEEMGSAQVTAHFGLGRQTLAPLIYIGCQEISLDFNHLLREPDEALAGNLQAVEFSVKVDDALGNPGSDQILHWNTDLGAFDRPQTRTDAAGYGHARLHSLSSGTARVTVGLPVNGNEETFDPVTFLDQPYFQYVRFSGEVTTEQNVAVTCRVVNLDSTPLAAVKVTWAADLGGFIESPAQSTTDADGVARITFRSDATGPVQVTVDATVSGEALKTLTSRPVIVHELARLVEMTPEEQYFVIQQSRPALFEVRLEPPSARQPVTWWDGDLLLATTYTSGDGRAGYQRYFTPAQVGEQVITVRSLSAGDAFDFKVLVTKAHSALAVVVPDDNPQLVAFGASGFIVDRTAVGEVHARAVREDGAGDDKAWVVFSLVRGIEPADLNISFEPVLGERVMCDEDGIAPLGINASKAAFLPNSDPENNEFVILATSNLGVTVEMKGRLRDFVDLAGSPIKTVEPDGAQVIGICGWLQRLDGSVPHLLPGSARLRASPAGDESGGVLTDLFKDSDARVAFMFAQVPAKEADKGRCAFFAVENLGKRLHFAKTHVRTFAAAERLADISLTAEGDDEVMLVQNGAVFLDTQSAGDLRVIVKNGDVPVPGIGYFRTSMKWAQASFELVNVLSDENGVITFRCDTMDVKLTDASENDLEIPGGIATLTDPLLIKLREFTLVSATAAFREESTLHCAYAVTFTRLPLKGFGQSQDFAGTISMNAIAQPFNLPISSSMVARGAIDAHPTDIPGTLSVNMSQSKRFVLAGTTHFPITDETGDSRQDAVEPGDPS